MNPTSQQQKLKLPSYGGQALIEGVLMRGKKALAAAFRAPDHSIVIRTEALPPLYQSQISQIPFLRGLVLLWDSLVLGSRYLTLSANIQTGEEEKLEGPGLYLTYFIALVVAVGLFFVAPAALSHLVEVWLKWNSWIGNFFEGIIRLFILLGYLWLVGQMPEISRVFAYHGAEHKTINAFEAGEELTPEKVMNYSVEHPRCGTSFLLTVVVFSIILFSLLGPLPFLTRMISRILLIPVLASISYEYIRWIAGHLKTPIIRFIIKPNLALQHLTTRPPTLEMLEVSIAAFNNMLASEQSAAPLIDHP
jgi:uncharacterized protein YqhQ